MRQRNVLQKNKDRTTEEELNETEINNLLDKEFKVIAIKMLTELEIRMDEFSENLDKEI